MEMLNIKRVALFVVVVIQISCLNIKSKHRKLSKEILEIHFNEMFKNDSIRIINNGIVIFNNVLKTERGGATGYFVKAYNMSQNELGFKVRLNNVSPYNEPFRDTFIVCTKPLNLSFYVNGIFQKNIVETPIKLYLGIDKKQDSDSLDFYWSDSMFIYM